MHFTNGAAWGAASSSWIGAHLSLEIKIVNNIIIIITIIIINIILLLLIVVMLEAQRWSVGAAGAAMVSQALGIPAAGPSCYPWQCYI